MCFGCTSVFIEPPAVPLMVKNDSLEGWKTYTNNEYGFSVQYPQYNEVKKYTHEDEEYQGIVRITVFGGQREHPQYDLSLLKDKNSTFDSIRQKILNKSPQTTFEEVLIGGYNGLLAHEPEGINGIEAFYFRTPSGVLMLSGQPPSDADEVIKTLKKL